MRAHSSFSLTAFLFAMSAAAAPQFIEQSRIIYPKQVGELNLAGVHYDKANVGVGVALTYELRSRPGVRIDVFIYPAGRMPEDEAMEAGVADLRASIEQATQAGYYGDVHMKGEKKLDLQVAEDVTLHGRMLSFDFTRDAVRYESRALLFYRFDYYYKLRTSTDAFEAAALDQALVQVAADLVPEIRVANRGNCSVARPSIQEQVAELEAKDPSARRRRGNSAVIEGRLSAEQALSIATFNRIEDQAFGCVPNFKYDAAIPRKGEEYTTIRFPQGAWD